MSTLFVPISTLPSEDWTPDLENGSKNGDSGMALPKWVGQSSPAISYSGGAWSVIPDSSNFEFVLVEEEDGIVLEKSLSFRFNAAELLERLQGMEEVFSERERIGCTLQILEEQLQKDLRLLRCQASPVVSLSRRENVGLLIFLNAIFILGDEAFETAAEGEFADPIDSLLAGKLVCLGAGVEVDGRGLKEIAGAIALSVVAIFPATVQANPGLSAVPAEEMVQVVESNLETVKTAKKLIGQEPLKVDRELLARAQEEGAQVVVDVSDQRARVYVCGSVALDTPVSTARKGKYTDRGTFKITQKVQKGKRSTIYGCALPFWMRLGESPIGMHVGELPGYPASAGCVRLPVEAAELIFGAVSSGTPVTVQN